MVEHNVTDNLPYDETTGVEGWQVREDARRMEGRSVGEALTFDLLERLRKRHGNQYVLALADVHLAIHVLEA